MTRIDMEAPTTSEQTRQGTGIPPLASEQGHWYAKDGSPVYEVEAKKGGMRATTIADARKLSLVPSVTNILNVAAKPGLEAWKAKQILESALTLPRIDGESLDDYALRVVEDSKAQSQKARDKGTELHAAIEEWIQTDICPQQWEEHITKLRDTLYATTAIDLKGGKAEHSFASPLLYGGKIDWHNDEPLIIDFKTKERIDDKKQLVWPEHVQQLAAYGFGLWHNEILTDSKYSFDVGKNQRFRALNVFVGTEDKQVRVFEHEWPDLIDGFACFRLMLELWQRTKKFGPYAKKLK